MDINIVKVNAGERLDELLKLEIGTIGIYMFEPNDNIIEFQDWVINSVRKNLDFTNIALIVNRDYTEEITMNKISKTIFKRINNFRKKMELDVFYLENKSFNQMREIK